MAVGRIAPTLPSFVYTTCFTLCPWCPEVSAPLGRDDRLLDSVKSPAAVSVASPGVVLDGASLVMCGTCTAPVGDKAVTCVMVGSTLSLCVWGCLLIRNRKDPM